MPAHRQPGRNARKLAQHQQLHIKCNAVKARPRMRSQPAQPDDQPCNRSSRRNLRHTSPHSHLRLRRQRRHHPGSKSLRNRHRRLRFKRPCNRRIVVHLITPVRHIPPTVTRRPSTTSTSFAPLAFATVCPFPFEVRAGLRTVPRISLRRLRPRCRCVRTVLIGIASAAS